MRFRIRPSSENRPPEREYRPARPAAWHKHREECRHRSDAPPRNSERNLSATPHWTPKREPKLSFRSPWSRSYFQNDRNSHVDQDRARKSRSEEHTSELQSLMRISYAVFCLKKKKKNKHNQKISDRTLSATTA